MVKPATRRAAPAAHVLENLPEYRNPPVSEVVVGVVFDKSVSDFLTTHLGLFWHRVIHDFPHSQHFAPFILPSGEPRWLDRITGLPLPRVWLISETKNDVIQLQGDCFFFNWRKLSDQDRYPRYPKIMERFEKYFGEFLAFLKDHNFSEPAPLLCELTYTNYVPQGKGWTSTADIAEIFKDFCWRNHTRGFLPTPDATTWTSVFPLPDGAGTLTAQLSQVLKRADSTKALRFDLAARGLGNAKTLHELRPWFDLSREWIVKGFADLTTDSAQMKLWERTNG